MTNNVKQRKNIDKRSRPKSWCVPSSRADLTPAITKTTNGFSKQALYHVDTLEEEKDTLSKINHKFTYRRLSHNTNSKQTKIDNLDSITLHGNTPNKVPAIHHDGNNNADNDKICNSGKHPKVIRRNNVDKVSRRAVVSLNFNRDYLDHVVYRPKKSRPRTLYRNIFRRSCNLLKFHVFGDNSKQETSDPFKENNDLSNGGMTNLFAEYNSILTDGESCIFSGDGNSQVGRDVNKPWDIYRSNNDVCQGVTVGSGESITGTLGRFNPEETESDISNVMPWTKRLHSMSDNEVLPSEHFECRRDTRKYSSLRSPSSKSKGVTPPKHSPCANEHSASQQAQFSTLKRHSNENIRFSRASSARFCRTNSMDTALRRKTINFTTQERFIDDNMKNINQKTMRNKKGEGRNAPNFFIRYQDVLREERITANPPKPYYDSSKFTQINEVFEYLLNLHCAKPVTKTCKQLFYIRSRLSKNARLNDSMCDGCFGCGKECFTIKT